MPTTLSGAEYNPLQRIVHAAFYSSIANYFTLESIIKQNSPFTLAKRENLSVQFIEKIEQSHAHIMSTMDNISKILPATSDIASIIDHHVRKDNSKLQHKISKQIHEKIRSQMLQYYETKQSELTSSSKEKNQYSLKQNILIDTAARGAGIWLNTIPTNKNLRMTDAEFIIAIRLRCGLPLYNYSPRTCSDQLCVKENGIDTTHALTCLYTKAKTVKRRHNAIRDIICKFLELTHADATKEPTGLDPKGKRRPDGEV